MTVQVDAIVNSVGAHLDMTGGPLSCAILSAAGDEIQDELRKVASRMPVKPGGVYVTKGHRLRCRHVLHAVCYSRSDGPDQISVQVSFLVREYTVATKKQSQRIFSIMFVKRCRRAVFVRPPVCLSVTFVYSVETNKHIFKKFSSSDSHNILVFPPCDL